VETVEKKGNKKGLLSATSIIIAALVIIIAANGVVWKNRLARSAEIDLLSGQLNQVSQNMTRAPAPPSDLEVRLALAKAGLTAAQTALPPEFNRNDVIDYIINLAKECRVEVLPISSQGWAVEKMGQSYPVLKLNGTITGSFTQANEFIYRLQNGKYQTLSVPEIAINRQSAAGGTGAFSGDNTTVTVRLNISIYARPSAAKGSQ
jgi:hypothetical protein